MTSSINAQVGAIEKAFITEARSQAAGPLTPTVRAAGLQEIIIQQAPVFEAPREVISAPIQVPKPPRDLFRDLTPTQGLVFQSDSFLDQLQQPALRTESIFEQLPRLRSFQEAEQVFAPVVDQGIDFRFNEVQIVRQQTKLLQNINLRQDQDTFTERSRSQIVTDKIFTPFDPIGIGGAVRLPQLTDTDFFPKARVDVNKLFTLSEKKFVPSFGAFLFDITAEFDPGDFTSFGIEQFRPIRRRKKKKAVRRVVRRRVVRRARRRKVTRKKTTRRRRRR